MKLKCIQLMQMCGVELDLLILMNGHRLRFVLGFKLMKENYLFLEEVILMLMILILVMNLMRILFRLGKWLILKYLKFLSIIHFFMEIKFLHSEMNIMLRKQKYKDMT